MTGILTKKLIAEVNRHLHEANEGPWRAARDKYEQVLRQACIDEGLPIEDDVIRITAENLMAEDGIGLAVTA